MGEPNPDHDHSASPDRVPIFPLSTIVLLPRLQTPLYIFEPRYRQMIADALAGDRLIGMVAVPPDRAHEMRGDPPVYPIATLGSLEHCSDRADGTLDISLLGVSRFRILSEPPRAPGQLYRSVEFETLSDLTEPPEVGDVGAIGELRARVGSLFRQTFAPDSSRKLEAFESPEVQGLDDERFVNLIALSCDFDTREVQTLVEADSIAQRYEGLLSLLQFRLADQGGCGSSDPSRIQ